MYGTANRIMFMCSMGPIGLLASWLLAKLVISCSLSFPNSLSLSLSLSLSFFLFWLRTNRLNLSIGKCVDIGTGYESYQPTQNSYPFTYVSSTKRAALLHPTYVSHSLGYDDDNDVNPFSTFDRCILTRLEMINDFLSLGLGSQHGQMSG